MSSNWNLYYIKVAIITATFFSSCDKGRTAAIKEQTIKGRPAAIAYNIRMVYTDSLQIKAILTAPEHLDYTNLSLAHSTFPKGLKVTFRRISKRKYHHC
jgi:hypothetical protein